MVATTPLAPQKNVVFHKKLFWSLVAVDAASAVADAQTSWHNERTYPNSVEHNSWLFGKRPSLGRYYATFAGMDGGAAFMSYKLLHARRRPLRVVGWGLLPISVGNHLYGVGISEGIISVP